MKSLRQLKDLKLTNQEIQSLEKKSTGKIVSGGGPTTTISCYACGIGSITKLEFGVALRDEARCISL